MRQLAIGFVVGAGVGAGGVYLYLKAQRYQEGAGGATTVWPAADVARSTFVSELGVPQTEVIRVLDGYVAAYDYRTRNPKWVVEHITKESVDGDANRRHSEFFEDPGIDAQFRVRLEDYRNSGYDRGHMAPAADHKSSQKSMDETFCLTNISPQVGKGFNRDYWARFEKFVRDLTRKVDDVFVITGPVWMPRPDADGKWTMQHPLIGEPPALVSVPTHYYKVVLADARKKKNGGSGNSPLDGQVGVGAFVLPNAPIPPQTPLSAFAVPIESLEQLAGVRFFPAYVTPTRRAAVDEAAQQWRRHGMQQLKPFDRVSLGREMAALPGGSTAGEASSSVISLMLPGREELALQRQQANTSVGASTSSFGAGDAGYSSETLVPVPKTRGAAGAIHLCELNGCKLPAEDFWLSREGSSGGGGNGSRGKGGGKPGPNVRSGGGRGRGTM